MWAELLRDFIIEVVGQPVHLIGNSFGGYLASIVGGLWPLLAKSIVLVNSVGFFIPEYSSLMFSKEREIARAAWFGLRTLLWFLRFNLKSTVRCCYPTRTERADDWLIEEMLRAEQRKTSGLMLRAYYESFQFLLNTGNATSESWGSCSVLPGEKKSL